MWRLPLARGGRQRSDWPGPRPGSPAFYCVRKIRNSKSSTECLREGRGAPGKEWKKDAGSAARLSEAPGAWQGRVSQVALVAGGGIGADPLERRTRIGQSVLPGLRQGRHGPPGVVLTFTFHSRTDVTALRNSSICRGE
ncbi:Hypothetical predicted protein [Lynx pardinus]|uniref:Uncharacterized protein n=1 Tax=Lynx pardinus TaxID=191816 RepID=A0A485P8K5_LYNPA|nr:Hypothetical predicted protein [Lynx pardinus]